MATAKRIPFDLQAVDKNVLYTTHEVWAFYNVPTSQYEFTTNNRKVAILDSFNNVFTSLTTGNTARDFHLLVGSRPMDTKMWADALIERAKRNDGHPDFENYARNIERVIEIRDLKEKYIFLGVKLGDRDSTSGNKLKDSLMDIARLFDGVLDTAPKDVTEAEREKWAKKEKDSYQAFSNALQAVKLASDDLAYVIKKQFFPAMPVAKIIAADRSSWGRGDITELTTSYIEPEKKHLRIIQTNDAGQEVEGYRTTLSVARLPEQMSPIFDPWIYALSNLPGPEESQLERPGIGEYAFSARIKVMPPAMVKADMKKKIRRVTDEAHSASEAGKEIPQRLAEQYQVARAAEYKMDRYPEHWVYANYKIIVEAGTAEDLKAWVANLVQFYSNMRIQLSWTTGDHILNLLETIPGGKLYSNSFEQIQNLNGLGGGMPTANNSVGNLASDGGWLGPYLGYTSGAGSHTPVFYSPHSTIARNKPPGVLITGQPGGGKTFAALNMTAQMALQGTNIIYIDPKQDAENLVLIPELADSKVIPLGQGEPGLLDPFLMGEDREDAKGLVRETIEFLVKTSMWDRVNDHEFYLNKLDETLDEEHPSMTSLINKLLEAEDHGLRNVAQELRSISTMKFGHLMFAPVDHDVVGINPWNQKITIFSLLGAEQHLLSASSKPQSDYSSNERIAMQLLTLLGVYSTKLMYDKEHKDDPKAVIVDEAWALVRTQRGKAIIEMFGRMGRAHNTAVVLITQNAGEFAAVGEDNLSNLANTVFTFGTQNEAEAKEALNLLGAEHTARNIQLSTELTKGLCLVRDEARRISAVQVDAWNQQWMNAFQSNPEERKKLKNEMAGR